MSLFFDSTFSQYCTSGLGNPINDAYPFVFSCWVKRLAGGGSGSGTLMVSGQSGILDQRNWMAINSSDKGVVGSRNTAQSAILSVSNMPVGQWFQLTARFHTSSFRTITYNGVQENTNGTSRPTLAPNVFLVGADPNISNYFNGLISHASIWTYTDATDWSNLRAELQTTRPEDISAGTLRHYWPGLQSDIVGGVNLTLINSPVESSDEPLLFQSDTDSCLWDGSGCNQWTSWDQNWA